MSKVDDTRRSDGLKVKIATKNHSEQKQVDQSNQRHDKSEQTQAQRTTTEPNHNLIYRKEKEDKSNKKRSKGFAYSIEDDMKEGNQGYGYGLEAKVDCKDYL
ncbi:hypothetical protein JHK82_048791 [Glycine max]|nr:hypothetical protein JHK86_048640 [Glycine max]KAG5098937.1 hypothetical protein JHK82_048791 [Glycine max]KAG5103705.1 hypothetical protein JHK84_048674 [Glycine max]